MSAKFPSNVRRTYYFKTPICLYPVCFPIRKFFCIVFLLGFIQQNANSQNRITDSSVTCIAYWKKGEQRKLRIIQSKENSRTPKDGGTIITYDVQITVLDSSDEGYKIRWIFHQAELNKAASSQVISGVPVFDGMEFIFLVSETGTFKSLINWEEVRDGYVNLLKLSLPQKPDPEIQSYLNKTIALFNSREVVENTLINEIQIYHGIYGGEFRKNTVTTATEIPSPMGDGSIPALSTVSVILPGASTLFYSLSVQTEMDIYAGKETMAGIFRKMDLEKQIGKEELDRMLAEMELSETSEYQVSLTDGWIRQVNIVRNTKLRDFSQKHWYSIELIE